MPLVHQQASSAAFQFWRLSTGTSQNSLNSISFLLRLLSAGAIVAASPSLHQHARLAYHLPKLNKVGICAYGSGGVWFICFYKPGSNTTVSGVAPQRLSAFADENEVDSGTGDL
jgi:hypothetical protein